MYISKVICSLSEYRISSKSQREKVSSAIAPTYGLELRLPYPVNAVRAEQALARITTDGRLLLMGIVQSLFDGAMAVWIVAYMASLAHVRVSTCLTQDHGSNSLFKKIHRENVYLAWKEGCNRC